VTPKGVASFSTRKYPLENEKLLFKRIKNWVQIFIPVLSLVLTIIILGVSEYRLKNKEQESKELKLRINDLENFHNELMKSKNTTQAGKEIQIR